MKTCTTVLTRRGIMMRCFFGDNPDNDSDDDHTLSRCVSWLEYDDYDEKEEGDDNQHDSDDD